MRWAFSALAALLLIGCAAFYEPPLPLECYELTTYREITYWVYVNVRYEPDPEYYDDWKLPGRTLADGAGDCEDRALLWCAIVNEVLGEAPMLTTWYSSTSSNFHAQAECRGYVFGNIPEYDRPVARLTYRQALSLAH
jgi:hypothetical protein